MAKRKKKPSIKRATLAQYVVNGGLECPACGSDNIEGGHVEIDAGSAYQPMHCLMCDVSWKDVYKLCYVDDLRDVDGTKFKVTITAADKARKCDECD